MAGRRSPGAPSAEEAQRDVSGGSRHVAVWPMLLARRGAVVPRPAWACSRGAARWRSRRWRCWAGWAWAGETFTAATSTLPVILFAWQPRYAVHVLGRYYLDARARPARRGAARRCHRGPPVTIAAATPRSRLRVLPCSPTMQPDARLRRGRQRRRARVAASLDADAGAGGAERCGRAGRRGSAAGCPGRGTGAVVGLARAAVACWWWALAVGGRCAPSVRADAAGGECAWGPRALLQPRVRARQRSDGDSLDRRLRRIDASMQVALHGDLDDPGDACASLGRLPGSRAARCRASRRCKRSLRPLGARRTR